MGAGKGHRVLDLAAHVAAFPLALRAHEHLGGAPAGIADDVAWPAAFLVLALWSASAWFHQLYDVPPGCPRLDELSRLVRTAATAAVLLGAVGFVAARSDVSRHLVALYLTFAFTLALGSRVAWRAGARALGRGHRTRRYAIVGTGGMAREIAEVAEANPEWRLQLAGFVGLDGAAERPRPLYLGPLARLGRILEEQVIDLVLFAVPRGRLEDVERAVHVCEEQGVEVRISLDVLRFGPGRMAVTDMDGVPMLAFTRTPTDALALAAKRAFDVVVSAAVLLLLSPVLAAVAVAIRLDSPGPVLFRQRRVGRNGRPFGMLKFRSMHEDAEQRLEALRARNEMTGPVFKMAQDPRVTRVGRFLRRTSLDEFPQFWNVLQGDMSVVGPRPPLPEEVRQYKRWQRRRLSMKPGITCIWQVSGRNNVDFERWMELDLQYIDEWSLWGDLTICLKTIPAVLSTRGAS